MNHRPNFTSKLDFLGQKMLEIQHYLFRMQTPVKALNPIKWSKRIYQWADLEMESHISYWIKSRVLKVK